MILQKKEHWQEQADFPNIILGFSYVEAYAPTNISPAICKKAM